ncbi:hypothetical protein BaRGS_00003427 [Batillaria attramentaria]|uniref:Uncharacterized protein n=1 Tax=Batillaria attramentaria TaxID=370345 RepID=A0ABD0M059_9CAEN
MLDHWFVSIIYRTKTDVFLSARIRSYPAVTAKRLKSEHRPHYSSRKQNPLFMPLLGRNQLYAKAAVYLILSSDTRASGKPATCSDHDLMRFRDTTAYVPKLPEQIQ